MYCQHHAPSPLAHLVLPRLPLRMRSEQQAGRSGARSQHEAVVASGTAAGVETAQP
eukprot:COSAG01_NODE_34618_length_544_cov_2.853933_1_plen_55_part_10